MRVSIDTELDEYDDAVRAVNAAYGYKMDGDESDYGEGGGSSPTTSSNGSTVLPGGWTEKKLRKWAGLLTEDAQEIVSYIAANPPEVSWDDVAKHLGAVKGLSGPVAGNVVGGAMSSGGHARKKLRGAPKNQPLDRDYVQRVYAIDERIAAILADELGAPTV